MEFATKEDLIKRYAEKRKGISEDEVRDLINALLEYTKNQLAPFSNPTEFAFRIENFGTFYEKEFNSKSLTKAYKTKERIKSEKMLNEFILTGLVRPKKVDIFNDKKHRI